MAEQEAINRARQIAQTEGWPWEDPVEVICHKKCILFGSLYWEVFTNANSSVAMSPFVSIRTQETFWEKAIYLAS